MNNSQFRKAIDSIEVSDEARDRMLEKIYAADAPKKKKADAFSWAARLALVTAFIAVFLFLLPTLNNKNANGYESAADNPSDIRKVEYIAEYTSPDDGFFVNFLGYSGAYEADIPTSSQNHSEDTAQSPSSSGSFHWSSGVSNAKSDEARMTLDYESLHDQAYNSAVFVANSHRYEIFTVGRDAVPEEYLLKLTVMTAENNSCLCLLWPDGWGNTTILINIDGEASQEDFNEILKAAGAREVSNSD